ncbi:DUF2280 domain-containing protein [Acinetobacter baumannii]|nr:DUF2280 domain-containing protein [Acinetobacter baumannii]
MAALKKEIKLYIVRSLAMFNTPQETVDLVNEEFKVKISRQQCERYDPTKRAGKDLSQELKDEFEHARKEFLEKPLNIPIANLTVRLQRLEKQYAIHAKNPLFSLKILEQAAKDIGGQFTNRQEITGKDGGPVQTVNSEVPVPMEDYLKARREVLDEY